MVLSRDTMVSGAWCCCIWICPYPDWTLCTLFVLVLTGHFALCPKIASLETVLKESHLKAETREKELNEQLDNLSAHLESQALDSHQQISSLEADKVVCAHLIFNSHKCVCGLPPSNVAASLRLFSPVAF